MFHYTLKDILLNEQHRRELLHDAERDGLAKLARSSRRSLVQRVRLAGAAVIAFIGVRLAVSHQPASAVRRVQWVRRRAH